MKALVHQLEKIGELISKGTIKQVIDKVFPLTDVNQRWSILNPVKCAEKLSSLLKLSSNI